MPVDSPPKPETPATSAAPARPDQPIVEPGHTPASVPRWAWHRRLYDWTMSLAGNRHATLALFILSVAEAIFFPIPSVVLQVPMTLARRERSWLYATVASIGCVVGGIVGYGLGSIFNAWFRSHVEGWFGAGALGKMEHWTGNLWLLSAGAIAVHPFKLYTIAAGILGVPFAQFIIAATIGRAVLFYGVGALLWWFGPPVRTFIEKYFNLLTVALGVLIVALVVGWRLLRH